MKTVMQYAFAIVLFLLALSCLITRVPDPRPTPGPDPVERFVWRLIFQKDPPSAQPDPDKQKLFGARIFGFFFFTLMGILLIANS